MAASLAKNAGSNPAWDMDVCLFECCACVVLRRADHLSRGVLPSAVCLDVLLKPDNQEDLVH